METSKHFSAWAWTENCFVIDFSINEMSKFVLCLDAGVKNEFYETRLMLIAGFNQESQKNPLQRMLFWLEQKTQHNFRSMAKKRKLSFFFCRGTGWHERPCGKKNHLQSEAEIKTLMIYCNFYTKLHNDSIFTIIRGIFPSIWINFSIRANTRTPIRSWII